MKRPWSNWFNRPDTLEELNSQLEALYYRLKIAETEARRNEVLQAIGWKEEQIRKKREEMGLDD